MSRLYLWIGETLVSHRLSSGTLLGSNLMRKLSCLANINWINTLLNFLIILPWSDSASCSILAMTSDRCRCLASCETIAKNCHFCGVQNMWLRIEINLVACSRLVCRYIWIQVLLSAWPLSLIGAVRDSSLELRNEHFHWVRRRLLEASFDHTELECCHWQRLRILECNRSLLSLVPSSGLNTFIAAILL